MATDGKGGCSINEMTKIQVTNTGETLVSRVEDEANVSELSVSATGITGRVLEKELSEIDFASIVDFRDLDSSNFTNANEECNITTGSVDCSVLVLRGKFKEGPCLNRKQIRRRNRRPITGARRAGPQWGAAGQRVKRRQMGKEVNKCLR